MNLFYQPNPNLTGRALPAFLLEEPYRNAIVDAVLRAELRANAHRTRFHPKNFRSLDAHAWGVQYLMERLEPLGCRHREPGGQPQIVTPGPESARLVLTHGRRVGNEILVSPKGSVSITHIQDNQDQLGLNLFSTHPDRRNLNCLTIWIVSDLRPDSLAIHLALVADHSDHASRLHCVDVETLFEEPLTERTTAGPEGAQPALSLT